MITIRTDPASIHQSLGENNNSIKLALLFIAVQTSFQKNKENDVNIQK